MRYEEKCIKYMIEINLLFLGYDKFNGKINERRKFYYIRYK